MLDPYRLALLEVRTATTMYLHIIREVAPVVAGIAEFEPAYNALGYAMQADRPGSPARIAAELDRLDLDR